MKGGRDFHQNGKEWFPRRDSERETDRPRESGEGRCSREDPEILVVLALGASACDPVVLSGLGRGRYNSHLK